MKELFDRWMALKFDIQALASIVQNEDIKVNGEDQLNWLDESGKFMDKIEKLREDTMKFLQK